jgi:restriction system protein
MEVKNLIFKRRISFLGVIMFLVISSFMLSLKMIKGSFRALYRLVKWTRNYIKMDKSGYSYDELCGLIKTMTGFEFEKFCCIVFKELGYTAKLTQKTNDGGKDIILYNEEEGYTYVECKRWEGTVGREVLQKLVGSATGDGIDNMLCITTGRYNSNATEYANKVDNLQLWTLKDLMQFILKLDAKRIPYIVMKTFNNANTRIIRFKPIKY